MYFCHQCNPVLSDPVLSAVQKKMVLDIWNNDSNRNKTLVSEFDLAIKGASLKKCEGTWLDDEVGNLIFLFCSSFALIKLYVCMHVCMYIYLFVCVHVRIYHIIFYSVMHVFHYFFTTGQSTTGQRLIGLYPRSSIFTLQ